MSYTISEGSTSTWSLTTVTASALITAAMQELGVLGQGETLSTSDGSFGLSKLNRMIDQWWARKEFIHYREIVSFAWTTSKTSYTIGPSGADFTNDRPIKIEAANFIRVGSAEPYEHVPIWVYEVDDYFAIPYPATSGNEVNGIYYCARETSGTIYPYPYPENTASALANKLELLLWTQLAKFTALDTAVSLVPGYEEAIVLSLAEKLAPAFERQITRDLRLEAARARELLTSINMTAERRETRDNGIPDAEAWA